MSQCYVCSQFPHPLHPACRPAAPHQKPVYKQLKKEADRRLKAEVARRGRTGKQAAADVLDRLVEAASGGSDEAWAAAVGQLSEAERAALAPQGDLEQYRQGLAARAAGGDLRGGEAEEPLSGSEAWEPGSEEEEEGSDYGEEGEEEESDWSTASEGEEEEGAAAGPSAAGQQPSFFWERAQHAQRAQRTQQGFSPLHFEVEAFAQRATPTHQEVGAVLYWCLQVLGSRLASPDVQVAFCCVWVALHRLTVFLHARVIKSTCCFHPIEMAVQAEAVQSAVLAVDAAARELWPHSRVALFGSQVQRSLQLAASPDLLSPWPCVCVCLCVPHASFAVKCTTLLCMWTLHRLASLCCCRPPAWRSPVATWTLWCWGWVPHSRAPARAFPKCRCVGWVRVSRCG